MTSDMGEMFNELKKDRQEKRASNREASPILLAQHGVGFVSKNGGAHLIVEGGTRLIDFWPGTGLWMVRGINKQGRGVMKLIKYLATQQPEQQ